MKKFSSVKSIGSAIFILTSLLQCGQGQYSSLRLPIQPDELKPAPTGPSLVWPYGVHGGGHPEGHKGIDFKSAQEAKVVASAGLTIISVQDNQLAGQNVTVDYGGGLKGTYQHLNPSEKVESGAHFQKGDKLGQLAFFEDEASYGLHFDVFIGPGAFKKPCPARFMSDQALNELGESIDDKNSLMGNTEYDEMGNEPKLCNPL